MGDFMTLERLIDYLVSWRGDLSLCSYGSRNWGAKKLVFFFFVCFLLDKALSSVAKSVEYLNEGA